MSCGLADYLNLDAPVYPAIVDEWGMITEQQVATFTPEGFCLGDCFTQGQGLGDITLTSPGGYFASGGDFTQWGAAEWGTVAMGAYALLSLWGDTKRAVRKTRKGTKAFRSAQ